VMSVTDHDTMAGVPEAAAAASSLGLAFVPGIEVTAVHDGRDVHVLGYCLDPDAPGLSQIIAGQRRQRLDRAREIAARLEAAGAPIDVDDLVASSTSRTGKSIARPQIAQALIRAGHVATVAEAFDRYLGEHCRAYVPHRGHSPHEVVQFIRQAGGVASLAHPGTIKSPDTEALIAELVEAGLDALEAYHSDHEPETRARLVRLARQHGLLVTGGSDYHGEGVRRAECLGRTTLPPEEFEPFRERAARAGGDR
jgi:3',5'-nucleoside bisphosphate phosphatase